VTAGGNANRVAHKRSPRLTAPVQATLDMFPWHTLFTCYTLTHYGTRGGYMMPTIRIDGDVWEWLKQHARPLEDNPNSVLRRIAGLDGPGRPGVSHAEALRSESGLNDATPPRRRRVRGGHTPIDEFRAPILAILRRHGGHLDRQTALHELEEVLADRLTEADRSDIESGTIRWEKTAEWQVYKMRAAGLLEPVARSGRGMWKLTPKGTAEARARSSAG